MKKTVIDKLLDQWNEIRGLTYPMVGYCFYSNIKGDGRNWRTVYSVANESGGVSYSLLNSGSPQKTARMIQVQLDDWKNRN